MADKNVQILAEIIKSIASDPSNKTHTKILENLLSQILVSNNQSFNPIINLSADPTVNDLPNNKWGVFRNDSTGVVTMWMNDNGVIKPVIGAN